MKYIDIKFTYEWNIFGTKIFGTINAEYLS